MAMRRGLVVALTLGIAVAGIFAGLVVAGGIEGQDSVKIPPGKQTAQAISTAEQATAEAGPRGPKRPITPAVSCPNPSALNPKTGIFPRDRRSQPPPPFKGGVENPAVAIGSNRTAHWLIS